MKKANNKPVAYIESGLYECLKVDAREVIFDSVYTDNNPALLIDISADLCKNLCPPWGEDMHVFSQYLIRNFVNVLLGQLGNNHGMYFRYGAWLYRDSRYLASRYSGNVFTLDMSNAICIYKESVRSLYLYEELPAILDYQEHKGLSVVEK